MKKKTIFKILAAAFCVAFMSVGFASCVSDDDPDPLAIKSVNVEYNLNLSQTYYDFYDITVKYLDELSQKHEIKVTEAWKYSFSVCPKVAPKNYYFVVTATPKAVHPDFDQDRYVLTPDVQGNFFCYRNNGELFAELSSDYYWYTLTNTDVYIFTAEQFKDYFKASSFRTLMLFEKTVDGKY